MPGGVSMVSQFTEVFPPPAVVKRAQRPNCHTAIGFSVVKAFHRPCVVPEAGGRAIPMPGPKPKIRDMHEMLLVVSQMIKAATSAIRKRTNFILLRNFLMTLDVDSEKLTSIVILK